MVAEQNGPVVIAHLLLRAGDALLLLRRAHTGRHDGAWAPPGGRVEAGELPRAAARRECLEETGVAVPDAALVPLAVIAFRERDRSGVNFLFSATLPAPAEIRLDRAIASDVLGAGPAGPRPCPGSRTRSRGCAPPRTQRAPPRPGTASGRGEPPAASATIRGRRGGGRPVARSAIVRAGTGPGRRTQTPHPRDNLEGTRHDRTRARRRHRSRRPDRLLPAVPHRLRRDARPRPARDPAAARDHPGAGRAARRGHGARGLRVSAGAGHDPDGRSDVAFKDADYAPLLVGSRPRSKGMERKDLIEANAAIFSVQGKALNDHASAP